MIANVKDYLPATNRVLEYLTAEIDAASPATVLAYCETKSGDVIELTLSDLMSVAYLAAEMTK